MKLSLAAVALLGETVVPSLSKRNGPYFAHDRALQKATSTLLQSNVHHETERLPAGRLSNRRLMRHAARNLKKVPSGLKSVSHCDPRSTDPDIGILSCGMDYICKPSMKSSLGGVCTPSKVSSQDQVTPTGPFLAECDPTSIDVGILGCQEGQYCKQDETSKLGGYCVDAATYNHRRLQKIYLEDMLYNCEPWPAEDPFGLCDCSDVNVTTGTGTMVCSQNMTASWVQGCDEYVMYDFFTYTFKDSVFVETVDCYVTTEPFNEKLCFQVSSLDTEPLCNAEWNDMPCNSCVFAGYTTEVDCSNVEGGRSGDSLVELSSLIEQCSNTTCTNLCGEGSYIPDVNFDISITLMGYNYTCEYLALKEENEAIEDMVCQYHIEAAQSGGCCVPLNSGGDNTAVPDPEPTDNTSIPGDTPDEEDNSSLPDAETGDDGSSAGQSLANIASVACQAAVVMALATRV